MATDIFDKATELLERLANSVYDRDPANPKPLFFSLTEVNLVEEWLKEFKKECKLP